MTERRQQERRKTVGTFTDRTGTYTLGAPSRISDRRQQASGAARNVATNKVQDETVSPDGAGTENTAPVVTADKSVEYSRPEQSAASCETIAVGEGRATRDEILAEIRNDPANTLFGLPLAEISRLIHEDKQHKATPSPTRTQPATEAEAEAWCKESEHAFDIVTEHGNGKVTVHFDQIYRGMAEFANHRAATPAAEKEGE